MAERDESQLREKRFDGEEERDGYEARAKWFAAPRTGPDGKTLTGIIPRAAAQRRMLEEARRSKDGRPPFPPPPPPSPPRPPGSVNWTPIGPSVIENLVIGPVSGRVRGIAVGPQGPNGPRAYAGAANGGVWLTNDGGATWAPLYPYQTSSPQGAAADSLSVGSMVVKFGATQAADILFVGTGEAAGGDQYLGVGVLSSTNGGGTITVEGINLANLGIWRLAMDPSNPAVVYAATTNGLYQRPLSAPFTNWTQVTSSAFTNATGYATDVLIAGGFVYAAFYGDAVYRFDGTSWTKLTGVVATAGTTSLRISLAACESDPTQVYAAAGQDTASLYTLSGTVFQAITGVPPFVTSQGFYDLTLAVSPTDPTEVYVGGNAQNLGASLFKGHIVGGSFGFTNTANPSADPTFIGAGIHVDVHVVTFAMNAAGTAHVSTDVWVGCDGGVYRSTSSGAGGTFSPVNKGLATALPTRIAQRPDTDAVVFVGAQDNNSLRIGGDQVGAIAAGVGDGGGVVVDVNNPNNVMSQGNGGLWGATDGGQSNASWAPLPFPPYTSVEAGYQGFYPHIAATPTGGPTLVAYGTHRVWINAASAGWGTSWVTIPSGTNPYANPPPDLMQDALDGTTNGVTALVFGSPTRLFVTNGTGIWMFDWSPTNTWTKTQLTTNGLPQFFYIWSIAVLDSAAGQIYVTLGGGQSPIWYLDGSGATSWIDCALVDPTLTPIHVPSVASVVDPDHPSVVYLGTDVGVFKGTRSAGSPPTWSWAAFSDGLPESAVMDLAIHERTRLLRAVTHGRGVWEIDLDGASLAVDPDIYLRVNVADTGRLRGGQRSPWLDGAGDPTAPSRTVHHWMSADIKVRRPMLSGLPPLGATADYYDFAANIGDYIQPSTNFETADLGGTVDRIFVEVHNRGATAIAANGVRVLLLLTDATAGLPTLPAGYANVLRTGVIPANWLNGTSWYFADTANPLRTTPGTLDVRTPQVVEYDVDFAALSLPGGHDHVCAAAFISTVGTSDQIAATQTDPSLDALTMHDKHVAHRNLHLVMPTATPLIHGDGGFVHSHETFIVDFHNPHPKGSIVDLVFVREGFSGSLALLLPRLSVVSEDAAFRDWKIEEHEEAGIRAHLGRWLERAGEMVERVGEAIERLGHEVVGDAAEEAPSREERHKDKLRELDRSRVYVAPQANLARIAGVRLGPHQRISAVVTIQPHATAAPGQKTRLHVIQESGGQIVGGSTYVIAVVKAH